MVSGKVIRVLTIYVVYIYVMIHNTFRLQVQTLLQKYQSDIGESPGEHADERQRQMQRQRQRQRPTQRLAYECFKKEQWLQEVELGTFRMDLQHQRA